MPAETSSDKEGRVSTIGMLDVADGRDLGIILQIKLLACLYLGAAETMYEICLRGRRKILTPKQQSRVRELQIENLGKTVIVNRTGKIYIQYLQAEVRH